MKRHSAIAALIAVSVIAMASMIYPASTRSAPPDEQNYVADVAYIEGYVMDSASGAGLPGVTVQIGETSMETNITGYFRIDGLSSGGHQVKASSNGYKSFNSTLSVTDGENAVIIRMEPVISRSGSDC